MNIGDLLSQFEGEDPTQRVIIQTENDEFLDIGDVAFQRTEGRVVLRTGDLVEDDDEEEEEEDAPA